MANPEHLEILKQGVEKWNNWRAGHPEVATDVSQGAKLKRANLKGVDLHKAFLCNANLGGADLSRADLRWARLREANLIGAGLNQANLDGADLTWADLGGADLAGASLISADLSGANLSQAVLSGADLHEALAGATIFASLDLSVAEGVDTLGHFGPSSVGIDTIYKSRGKIPKKFLRGCGLADWEIEVTGLYDPSLSDAEAMEIFYRAIDLRIDRPIQRYSCFISYSTKDQRFADRIYADLQNNDVRCWYAPHDIQGGRKIHEQIDEAIRLHDKMLLILSEHSMKSEWVKTELAKARKREVKDDKRVLFPVRLAPFEVLRDWENIDSTGVNLAEEIRQYFIPDFSDWKDHDSYRVAFDRLVKDLKQSG